MSGFLSDEQTELLAADIRANGIRLATELCQDLLDGGDGSDTVEDVATALGEVGHGRVGVVGRQVALRSVGPAAVLARRRADRGSRRSS